MRRTSIISMIVAAVIIVAGIIVCIVGAVQAKNDGYMLYPANEDGESVYKHDFTEEDVSRLEVVATDAEVYFTRGGDRSYIEIRNFNTNYYKLSTDNGLISFTEVDDVMSMFKFWEGGFSFKGMRYIFRLDTNSDKAGRVTVNLAEGANVANFSLKSETGLIDLSDISLTGDVNVTVGEAQVTLDSLKLDGTLAVSSNKGTISAKGANITSFLISGVSATGDFEDLKCNLCRWEMKGGVIDADGVDTAEFAVSTTAADVTAKGLLTDKVTVLSGSGKTVLSLSDALTEHSTELTSKSGSIFVDGTHYTGSCSLTGNADRVISITSDSGAISLEGIK